MNTHGYEFDDEFDDVRADDFLIVDDLGQECQRMGSNASIGEIVLSDRNDIAVENHSQG